MVVVVVVFGVFFTSFYHFNKFNSQNTRNHSNVYISIMGSEPIRISAYMYIFRLKILLKWWKVYVVRLEFKTDKSRFDWHHSIAIIIIVVDVVGSLLILEERNTFFENTFHCLVFTSHIQIFKIFMKQNEIILCFIGLESFKRIQIEFFLLLLFPLPWQNIFYHQYNNFEKEQICSEQTMFGNEFFL